MNLTFYQPATCELEADNDSEGFNESLGKMVKYKPVEKPE